MDGIRALCDVARMKALLIVAMLPFLQSCDSPATSSGATDIIASVETVDVDARDPVPDASKDTDDDSQPTELVVIENIPVDFNDMQAGVVESVIINLDDLRDEDAYANVRSMLVCGRIDVAGSFIKVDALDGGPTTVSYQVGVGRPGASSFTRLAAFNGALNGQDEVPLSSSAFTVDADGQSVVSEIVLGDAPTLSLQISASVAASIQSLQVTLSLALHFSSAQQGCR